MKILKNNGPKIDPCGTPESTFSQVLYEELTLVL